MAGAARIFRTTSGFVTTNPAPHTSHGGNPGLGGTGGAVLLGVGLAAMRAVGFTVEIPVPNDVGDVVGRRTVGLVAVGDSETA
eukprot:CAMPEP_0116574504 /NCGR_PEP_ID=MMETSP0397-20121206/19431_1 /TAXON_ID=216820 /ORGANISM="Cyclophora tenuis, Strain ECT3854" /LENGTH=82 /DNA_ID=CAMNT_0004103277 /DNA_START=237 /DNA_END=481 /DNA_ORIENTATION=+